MASAQHGWRSRATRRLIAATSAVATMAATAGGCLQILGDEGPFVLGTGGTTGGTGGSGGEMSACEPAVAEACYEGPDGTLDEGVCKGGMHTCGQDGTWGTCSGQVLPGVETCASKDDEDCDKNECARWSLISGGNGGMAATALTTDSQGNIVVTGGIVDGQVTLGDKTLDATVNGPLFLAKLDPSGTVLWVKTFGGVDLVSGAPLYMMTDSSDSIIMGGNFEKTLNLGGLPLTAVDNDFFMAKFTENGVHAWSKSYGGDMNQDLANIAVAKDGSIRFAGTYDSGFFIGGSFTAGAGIFYGKVSPSDGSVTSIDHVDPLNPQFTVANIAADSDGTWILSGNCSDGTLIGGQPLTPCQYFVAKFASDDTLLWSVSVPRRASVLAVGPDASVFLGGDFSSMVQFGSDMLSSKGASDVFIAKLSGDDGAVQWAKAFGGAGDEIFPQMTIDSQDRIYFALNAQNDIDFGGGALSGFGLYDMFVVALDASGNHRWSRVFGDPTEQGGALLAIRGGNAGLVVSARTPGQIDFGAGPLQATSPLGLAIAELGP